MNLNKFNNWIQNLSIKSKLYLGYLLSFLVITLISSSILYFKAKNSIISDLENELSNATMAQVKLIEAATNAAAINQLKVSAEKNLQIIAGIYQTDLKESQAKQQAADILKSQSIGKTGYLYVVDSRGTVLVHPDSSQIGEDFSSQYYIRKQLSQKYGLLEYSKKTNNGKDAEWLTFITYFGPWDWIIAATVKRAEFTTLLDMASFRKSILSQQFGRTGYSFLLDREGTLLVHPKLEGKNSKVLNLNAQKIINTMMSKKSGKLQYSWETTNDYGQRDKITFFSFLPEYDWIIASSAYVDEYFLPLKGMKYVIFFTLIITIFIFSVVTRHFSMTITTPIKYLTQGFKAVSNGDLSVRLSPEYHDEMGKLESYFNTFIAQLQKSNNRLKQSEKGFRTLFENSVEGIFQLDMDGKFLKVNPSMVAMLGHNNSNNLLNDEISFQDDVLVNKELWNDLCEQLISNKTVKGLELQIRKKSGSVLWCLLNARAVKDIETGTIGKIDVFLSDIDAQEQVRENLETIVNKRTMELSNRIAELEQRNANNLHLGKMADMLQSCRTIEETYPVIKQYFRKLLPNDQCYLYLHDDNKKLIDRVVPPVTEDAPVNSMTNDSCWALRQGKPYLSHGLEDELLCEHVDDTTHGYFCIPLIAHGVTIGLLHVQFAGNRQSDTQTDSSHLDRKKRLSSRLAEHLSLALANLKLREELKLKSIQDSLTGLFNRRHMEEIMQRQFYRMRRYNTPFSIIMLDIDHFKAFNDSYGHELGDIVLQQMAQYLTQNTRGEDVACRYGGEEFVLILINASMEDAIQKAEKVRAGIEEQVEIPYLSKTLHVTASLGVASSPQHGRNIGEIIKSADKALYRAKENGRNRVEPATTVG